MSTRNTKPSAVRASSRRISDWPRRVKYSSFATLRGAVGLAALGKEEDEVDVGGEIELAAAELAHADDEELLRLARRRARRAVARLERAPRESERGGDRGVGEREARASVSASGRSPARSRQAMRTSSRRRRRRSASMNAGFVAARRASPDARARNFASAPRAARARPYSASPGSRPASRSAASATKSARREDGRTRGHDGSRQTFGGLAQSVFTAPGAGAGAVAGRAVFSASSSMATSASRL